MFKINKSTTIIYIFVLIIFLQNPPWFFWGSGFYILCICVLISSLLLFKKILSSKRSNHLHIFFSLFLFFFFVVFHSFQQFRLSSLVTIIVFIQLFYINSDEKLKILDKITSVLFYIIIISLPLWLINQFLYNLPFKYEMNYGDWKGDGGTKIIENYLFFVQAGNSFINRFYSVFDEPGVLGTLSSFLLFANRYNFKDKRNVVILIGGMFTYSLAFFVLFFLGMTLYYIREPKKWLKYLSFCFVLLIILFTFFYKSEVFGEVFNVAIVDRLDRGSDAADSRISETTNRYFNTYITTGESILGKGTLFLKENPILMQGQGFQFFLIEYGFAGLFLVIGMYLFGIKENNFLLYSYLALFLFSFIQRPFLFTSWQLIIYYVGCENLYSKEL